jgi:TldD protein
MYLFPKNLYTDVRIETVTRTKIALENFQLKQNKVSTEKGAMIRIFDGDRWYYSATTEVDHLQEEIDKLARMATLNPNIDEHPVVKRIEVNKETCLRYIDCDISKISNDKKLEMLNTYIPMLKEEKEVQLSKMFYLDNHTVKHIISSKGTDITFDTQNCAIAIRYTIKNNNIPYSGLENVYKMKFEDLANHQNEILEILKKDIKYNKEAVPVKPGTYTCVLSPVTTGVFAHESFGHKSEADFMIGDEVMKREWSIGKQVGAPILNIIDTGLLEGSGYVPFDDEGCRAKENYIIKDGILKGRLHSSYTAALLEEEPTGNARAINFEFEPIVRMTTTYIGAGNLTKEELIGEIEEGIYIDDINHGSGMTTFTIAPRRAYMIRNGKLAEPVRISVISGNVMSTLYNIDGISKDVELLSFVLGGCGKLEQYPLSVGFGGPYIRVNGIVVQ